MHELMGHRYAFNSIIKTPQKPLGVTIPNLYKSLSKMKNGGSGGNIYIYIYETLKNRSNIEDFEISKLLQK